MFDETLIKAYPRVTSYLSCAIKKRKLANSYTFIGKDKEKSFLVAFNLAKLLNCNNNKNFESSPCNTCTNCRWLEKREHPEALIVINPDPSSKKEQVKVDTIRELVSRLQITSNYFRVIYFVESSLISLPQESSNLLLKITEETPQNTLFIFSASNTNEMLPTILSRSQVIYLVKKYNSLQEVVFDNRKFELGETIITNFFPKTIKEAIEKSKNTIELFEKNEINLKDYLSFIVLSSYKENKLYNLKQHHILYDSLNNAYLKSKSFISHKIVIEDLFYTLSML